MEMEEIESIPRPKEEGRENKIIRGRVAATAIRAGFSVINTFVDFY